MTEKLRVDMRADGLRPILVDEHGKRVATIYGDDKLAHGIADAYNASPDREQMELDAVDAARYRWLRESRNGKERPVVSTSDCALCVLTGEHLDDAIDSAISTSHKP